MKTLAAAPARRRFGALLKAVQHEPVLVRRKNGYRVVLLSAAKYKLMTGVTSFEPEPLKLTRRR